MLLSFLRYGDISICQADFFFFTIKINYSNANRRQVQQNYKHAVRSSITILKHSSIYQNNHSQVLDIISVNITFMNTFENFFGVCIAHDLLHHSSAVILMYRLKRVPGNFRYCHTPMS